MSNYILMTDSACDLSKEVFDRLQVTLIPMTVTVEDPDLAQADLSSIDTNGYYRFMRDGKKVTTAAPNPAVAQEWLEPHLKAGMDVLYLGFSSALSYTYTAVSLAAEELKTLYPDRTVKTVDTLCASAGQGLLLYLVAQKKAQGASLEEAYAFACETAPRVCHYFTVDDLFFLKRGGRVSAAAAVFGTMLQVKPVLHVDEAGRLIPIAKVRGRKASLEAMLAHMEAETVDLKNQTVFLSYGDCQEEASAYAQAIRERFSPADVQLFQISPVVGAHSGPTTIALFFLGEKR